MMLGFVARNRTLFLCTNIYTPITAITTCTNLQIHITTTELQMKIMAYYITTWIAPWLPGDIGFAVTFLYKFPWRHITEAEIRAAYFATPNTKPSARTHSD
jgi:hypothetical protein